MTLRLSFPRIRRGIPWATALLAIGWCLPIPPGIRVADARGLLSTLREDVRAPRFSSDDDDDRHSRRRRHSHGSCDDDDGSIFAEVFGPLVFHALTSPFWGPAAALGDDYGCESYFARFPYDNVPGYMMRDGDQPMSFVSGPPGDDPALHSYDPQANGYWRLDPWPTRRRRYGVRLSAEYGGTFNDLHRIGGHLLLETTSRLGLDTETSYLEETFPGGATDQLWLGDCNVTFRFGQSEHMQWRSGLGFNWLDDQADTNFGFNFTYGFDYFPARPWVVSATIDWGTLGSSDLFRFRTTTGVIIWGIESYVGYEYLDVDRTQLNSLIAGVRIWF